MSVSWLELVGLVSSVPGLSTSLTTSFILLQLISSLSLRRRNYTCLAKTSSLSLTRQKGLDLRRKLKVTFIKDKNTGVTLVNIVVGELETFNTDDDEDEIEISESDEDY